MSRYGAPFVLIPVTLCSMLAFSQTKGSIDDLADALVHWKTSCSKRGCLLQTDVLRGESGDPPDRADFREYVGIDVALERATQRPAYFAFYVDPRAQSDQGIFVAFTKTTNAGDSWKTDVDSDAAFRLPLSHCDEKSCAARVPLGVVSGTEDGRSLDLLAKFLSADHMLLLYVKGGKAYRTMVLLASFKKEYERVLATDLKASGAEVK